MNTKKIRIEHFLLLTMAFLFQFVTKDRVFVKEKDINFFLEKSAKEEKTFYSFIREFQEKTTSLGVKKTNNFLRKNEFLEPTTDNFSYSDFYFGALLLNKRESLVKTYDRKISFNFVGLGEKMHKGTYLV